MKKILLPALLLLPVLVQAQTIKPFSPPADALPQQTPGAPGSNLPAIPALDDKNGFRDLKFGSRLVQMPGMVRLSSGGELYNRLTDKLTIGQGQLKSIAYAFHHGVFYGVHINVVGQGNSYAVLEALKSQYGEPYQPNQYLSKYYWFGRVASVSFDENSISHDAAIFIYNTALLTQVAADEKEKAKAKAGDL